MSSKLHKIFPVRAGQNGPWIVHTSTIRAEGLEAVRGQSLKEFNRHLETVLPEGTRAAVFRGPNRTPAIVTGHRLPDIAA